MAKTKQMRWVHRAVARAAVLVGKKEGPEQALSLARQFEHEAEKTSMPRRDALKVMGAMAALPLMASAGCGKERRLANTTVAVIGGGLAGLTAALKLQDKGMTPQVYEASNRFGGRAMTVEGVLNGGRSFEAGGEFIDQEHEWMLSLVNRFGLGLDDLEASELDGMRYLFNGEEVSMEELVEATAPFLPVFLADAAALEADYDAKAAELDAQTCMEYWDMLGLGGVLRAVLEVAVLTEFGRASSQLSALHFVEDLPQVHDGTADVDGVERYKFSGGTQALVQAMVQELGGEAGGRLMSGARLLTVKRNGRGFNLTFDGGEEVEVDIVLLGMPLPALRQVAFEGVDLPDTLKTYIAEAGMGVHAKVIAGFTGTPWRNAGYDGEVLSNAGLQTCWDTNPLQAGDGSLTFLLGGDAAVDLSPSSADTLADGFTDHLSALYPELPGARNGVAWAMNWGQEAGFEGSYSCLNRGQYTAAMDHFYFEGDQEERQVGFVDNLGFIGEAFSGDYWGYMEGAVQTGGLAAKHVVDELV
ncbi:MAG: FAD-dependent oxidoreductase [Flavobacteriales bacterium]|nr:FAD-dependent oxidoreductase [Flavobacteriales bacterium]